MMRRLGLAWLVSTFLACAAAQPAPVTVVTPPRDDTKLEREREAKLQLERVVQALDARCKELIQVGVTCRTLKHEGRAMLLLHYETNGMRDKLGNTHVGELAAPFCRIANPDLRPFVRVEVHGKNHQDLDCQDWTWVPLVVHRAKTPEQHCQDLRDARVADQSCTFRNAGGMVNVIITLPSAAAWQHAEERLAEQLREPFCAANNERGWPALYQLRLVQDNRGRNYSCELRKWGDWFPLRPERAAPAQRSQGSST